MPSSDDFKLKLRKSHLEQLRKVRVSPLFGAPRSPDSSLYDQLVNWSNVAKEQIANAIVSQVVSPDNIDWNIEILTMLESAAVDLRNEEKVVEAIQKASEGTKDSDKRALELLEDSQVDIKRIAALWGLEFEVVCDLMDYSPEGHPWFNGPYCGIFWPKDWSKPFIGLTFKGANFSSLRETLKVLNVFLFKSVGKILWGSPIHKGFYISMFENFPQIASKPFDYIKNTIHAFVEEYPTPEGTPINLHLSGHSLGGAYSTMCYAELVRLYNNAPTTHADNLSSDDENNDLATLLQRLKAEGKFVVRDLYNFGSPRVGGWEGSDSWARNYQDALAHHVGKSWRVANEEDPVTLVPPVLFSGTWNHIDNAYKISFTDPPQPLPTEVDTETKGPDLLHLKLQNHSSVVYIQNLYKAANPSSTVKADLVDSAVDRPLTQEDLVELGINGKVNV